MDGPCSSEQLKQKFVSPHRNSVQAPNGGGRFRKERRNRSSVCSSPRGRESVMQNEGADTSRRQRKEKQENALTNQITEEPRRPLRGRKSGALSEGQVVTLREGFGFLKLLNPSVQLPAEDVYFKHGYSSYTQTGLLELRIGDVLEIALGNSDKKEGKRSFAIFARLLKCTKRTPVVLGEYVDTLVNRISSNSMRADDVLRAIVQCPVGFISVLGISMPSKEIVISVLKLCDFLSRKAEAALNRARFEQFFGLFRGSHFLSALEEHVFCFCDGKDEHLMSLFRSFLTASVRYVPEMGHELVRMLVSIHQNSFSIEEDTSQSRFCRVLVELLRVFFRGPSESAMSVKWNELPLVPFVDELFREVAQNPLPCVKKQGSYGSFDSYVDTYIRLLREDCFGSLKKGIKSLKAGRLDIRDMKVWVSVSILGIHFNEREPGVTLLMRAERIRSQDRKKFLSYAPPMPGNLICISLDSKEGSSGSFKSPVWATVFKSQEVEDQTFVYAQIMAGPTTNPSACVAESIARLLGISNTSAMFVENPSFYKAYEPVLRGLQQMQAETFPFFQEIVHARWTHTPPDYLTDPSVTLDFSAIFGESSELRTDIGSLDGLIKSGYKVILDESQLKAVKLALRNRLVLIQGPPGTGKTFLGAKILQILLSAATFPAGPALVITYKNQGLDHFLKACLHFCPNGLVRVGGRSTEPSLDAYNLRFLVKKYDEFTAEYDEYLDKLKEARHQVEEAIQNVCDSSYFNMDSVLSELNDDQLRRFIFQNHTSQNIGDLIPDGMSVAEFINNGSEDSKTLKHNIISSFRKWMPKKEVFEQVKDCLGPPASATLTGSLTLEGADEVEYENEEIKTWTEQCIEAKLEEEDIEASLSVNNANEQGLKGQERKIFKPRVGDKGGSFKHITLCEIYKEQHLWLLDENLWELNQSQRAILVQIVMDRYRQNAIKKFEDAKKAYDEICKALEDIDRRRKLRVLQEAKIVGMTATGVAMYQEVIRALRPSLVFVEEAAEVLEPQLVVAIGPGVQHIVLIGDHYQLAPSVENYELEKRHDFAVSLFERLVQHNGMPYQSLMRQSRMRVEFVPMIEPIYPGIRTNYQYVSGERNSSPECMVRPMYFWSHAYAEDKKRSVTNPGEAQMVFSLLRWLVSEGQTPGEITVLCAYNGQATLIRRMVKSDPDMPEVQAVTVDRFQGSENKIIILSLVRSNSDGVIGHLGRRSRMCVAVSRARGAFYICGDMATLTKRCEHWRTLLDYMRDQECVGEALPVKCPRHPNVYYLISSKDVKASKPMLCGRACTAVMDCGHTCNNPCHFGNHPKCKVMIDFRFKICGHQGNRKCFEDEDTILCKQEVKHTFELCKHCVIVKCWQKTKTQLKCHEPCLKILDCGHHCKLECFKDCKANECKFCVEIQRAKLEQEKKQRLHQIKLTQRKLDDEIKRLKSMELELLLTDLQEDGSTAAEYMQVVDRTERFIQPGHNMALVVTRIQKVFNRELEIRFLNARRNLFEPNIDPQPLFHGTDNAAIEGITKEGFRLPSANKNNMFGRGCYFATDSSKSAQNIYTKGSNKLLLCSVLLGQTWTVQEDHPDMDPEKLRKKGFDSIYSKRGGLGSGGTRYDEFIVYNPAQALPKYIVHFKCMKEPNPLNTLNFPGNFSRLSIQPSDTFPGDSLHEFHFRVAESQFYRMSQNRNVKVMQVDLILNKELQQRYDKAKSQMGKNVKEKFVFHGTTKDAIDKIIVEGFKIGGQGVAVRHGAAYGTGVYTALNPDISISYCSGEKMMLLSLALVGSLDHDYTEGSSKDVYVFKHSEYLLPRYVVHFT